MSWLDLDQTRTSLHHEVLHDNLAANFGSQGMHAYLRIIDFAKLIYKLISVVYKKMYTHKI